jgi:glutamyl-tRNA synthetase
MYDGKFILRFDDTNPENAFIEFYDAQREDLRWIDIEWDEEYNTSDNLKKHYKLAEKLIDQGNAYVCICDSDFIKECRYNGKECDCKCKSQGESIDIWKEMLTTSIEGAILRLKGDMKCENTAMRDPTLFRIIDKPHPLHGDKYRVWSTYDFAGAVEDSLSGVTHPFRTKEYELRDECYYRLLDLLNLRKPNLMEFARLSIEGMPVSKRKIKPLIEKGLVQGYDDIRLPTLRGLKKRGILPNAIKKFILSQGISKVESMVNFGILEAFNRKIVDPNARRYFFVKNPVKLVISNAPKLSKTIRYHPNNEKLGIRKIDTFDTFFIQSEDLKNIEINDVFRLKDLFNVMLIKKDNEVYGEYVGKELIKDSLKIQWTTDDFVKAKIYVPHSLFKNNLFNKNSIEEIEGYAENDVKNIKSGEIVQFERFGFTRIQNKNGMIVGFFSHK